MVRNKDFAMPYAGRAVFDRNGELAGAVAGRNDMHGVIPGADHSGGRQAWGIDDTGELNREHEGVRGIRFSTDAHGNVQAAYIRGKHGGMKLAGMGDGSENVSSKI